MRLRGLSPPLPARSRGGSQRKRAERGFVTGFPGRETALARPSRSPQPCVRNHPAMFRGPSTPNPTAMPRSRKPMSAISRLEQLALSPTNARKTPATAAEDAELEASIRAKGVLQNLIVHPAGERRGLFGRRRRPPPQDPAEARRRRRHRRQNLPGPLQNRRARGRGRNLACSKTRSAPRCIRRTNSSPWRR